MTDARDVEKIIIYYYHSLSMDDELLNKKYMAGVQWGKMSSLNRYVTSCLCSTSTVQ